jgi:hypothetical protein
MYPRSQERHRNREATVYLPALGGAGLGRSYDQNIQMLVRRQPKRVQMLRTLLAVSTEASGFSVMGNPHCRRREQI